MNINSKTIRDYQKTIEAIFPKNDKAGPLSFKEWRSNVQLIRDMLMVDYTENCVEKIRIDEEFSPNFAASKKAAIDAVYNEAVELSQELARRKLSETVSAKRELFHKAMKAPTEEQLRLLQVLSMRQHVGSDEIHYFAESLADNLPALRCLGEISEKNDIPFPAILDGEDLERLLNQATSAADKYISSIGIGPDDLQYEHRLFWTTSRPYRESSVVDILDAPGFMRMNVNEHGDAGNAAS